MRVRVLQSVFEEQQVESFLAEAGVPCMVQSYGDTAMDGLYQTQKGWGEVRVPERMKARAQQVLNQELSAAAGVGEE